MHLHPNNNLSIGEIQLILEALGAFIGSSEAALNERGQRDFQYLMETISRTLEPLNG